MWEFLKNEGNSRALAIIIPIVLAIVGGSWAAFTHFSSQPKERFSEYYIYLDSEITPFVDGYVDEFFPPFKSINKPTENSNIWYVRRDKNFVPHSILPYFKELSDQNKQEIIKEISAIRSNKLLHETLLPEGFFKVMNSAGIILDKRYRKALASKEKEYSALSNLLGVHFEDEGSIAAFFMYHTNDDLNKVIDLSASQIFSETREIWHHSSATDSFESEDKLATSLILGQYNPVFLVTASNLSDKTMILSDITVDAERIRQSASGLKSEFVDVIDTVVIPLKGLENESVNKKFSRPITVPPGESATLRIILDSELMFIYKIQITLFNGQQQVHKFEPFVVDYFSEI